MARRVLISSGKLEMPQDALTPGEFQDLFTPAEYMALVDSTDANVRYYIERIRNSSWVERDDQRVKDGLDYSVSIGLLTANRRDELWSQLTT